MITQQELKKLFRYEPSTGKFFWLVRIPGCAEIGDEAGYINNSGYVMLTVNKKRMNAHRAAWLYVHGSIPAGDIDHINNKRADNRIVNLRIAKHAENMRNRAGRQANNTSGVLGVTWYKARKRWRAQIFVDGRGLHLGLFKTIEEARQARIAGERKYFGRFASKLSLVP